MKRIALLMLALASLAACNTSPEKFVISGSVDGIDQGMARVRVFQNGDYVYLDSIPVQDGTFTLQGSVDFPTYAYVEVDGIRNPLGFFVENDSIFVHMDKSNPGASSVEGSASNDILDSLYSGLNQEQQSLMEQYRAASIAGDTALTNSLIPRFNELYEQRNQITQDYIDNNKSSVITPYLVRTNNIYSLSWEQLDSLVATFDPALEASPYTKFFHDRVATLKRVDIGQPAPDFTQADTSGNPLSLSSLIGKSDLLLVDFWASWCGPCRRENPNIVAIYRDYHDKGFDVLGVSLDRQGEGDRWKQAIRSDSLSWHHMSDLQYWNNAAAKLYGVMAIPHSVLLDKNGIIIAQDLRGDDLRNKVAELLDK